MTRRSLKASIRDLLAAHDLDGVAALALERRRTLGQLVSLTFDADPLIVHRAIEATGICAERLLPTDPESVLEHLRRLLWMITEESGGICWHAPELMAEIVRRDTERFENHLTVTASFLTTMEKEDLEHFRPAALRAVGLLGEIPESVFSEVLPAVISALGSSDPQTRGMAVWALDRLGETVPLADEPGLRDDMAEVGFYEAGLYSIRTVADLVREALNRPDPAN